MDASFDFLSDILDEIALEGLDGITLSALWIRLGNRPHFSLSLGEDSKTFIWECLAAHKGIEIYELPEARPPLVLFNRYDYLDPEFGLVTEPSCKPQDIYPIEIVDDKPFRGSCKFYTSRKVITSQVRYGSVLLMSLKQAMEVWGDKLVLVASPQLRLLALVGEDADPALEMTKEQYCLLERIGRARYHGDVSQGESGLLTFKMTSIGDNMHYHLSKLIKGSLITKQKHILRTNFGKTVTGLLFHLTRFYVLRKVKCDTLLEFMYCKLKDKPDNREESRKLQEEMGLPPHTYRKLLKRFAHKWFRLSLIPHSKLYPEDAPECGKLKNGEEKLIKVIQMFRPYVYEEEIIDSEDEDEDSNKNPYFDPTRVLLDKPLLCQAYKVIVDAGPNGITLGEVRNVLTLPRLDIRGLCRLLIKKNKVITVMQEKGRQRYERFIAKQFQSQSISCINIREQASQFTQQQQEDEIEIDGALTPINGTNGTENIQLSNEQSNTIKVETNFENVKSQIIEMDSSPSPMKLKLTPSLAAAISPMVEYPDRQVSARLLKRANILTAFLKHSRVSNVTELLKVVKGEEKKEGYKYEVDKRSIMRLVTRLCTDNRMKVLKAILKQGETTKALDFVCHPSVDSSDIEFKAAIEQAKFLHFSINKVTKKYSGHRSNDLHNTLIHPRKEDKENVNRKILTPVLARQFYGLQPKFSKAKALHLFLCYLIHYYDGPETEEKDEPFEYHNSDSWKRFIPPLPKYKKNGWFILSDAISRMPLSIFVKIINLKYEMLDLEELLKDPIKQQCLIKHLPQELRSFLLGDRKYLFSISDVLNRLSHMGLLSFGPKTHFQKDQVYIYVYRNAQIKDTSLCSPAYLHIDKAAECFIRKYNFQKLSDVENYWIDLETTCLNTLLGRYGVAEGQKICVLDPNQKPDLLEALRNKDFNEIDDIGIPPPGDGLGAAGLDSSLFAHLRRNWAWPSANYKIPVSQQKQKRLSEQHRSTLQYLLETGAKKINHSQSHVRLQRLKRALGQSKKRPSEDSVASISPPSKIPRVKPAKKIRTVRSKALKKQRRPFYDDKDRVAMGTMRKMRVDWTPQEDSLLLMCKVTSMFLDIKSKCLVVPCTVVRDILNVKLPQFSLNKTSRACQRRLRHMLVSSKECRNSVGVFLGEAKQDTELVKEFDVTKPPKTKEDRWKEMFSTLLDKLLLKFTSSGDYNDTNIIPDTIAELQSQYNVVHLANVMDFHCQYKEPESDVDIYHAVISTVIFSSLSSMADGKNWSHTLYKIYEQYPDNLLHAVIDELHKKRLITKKVTYRRLKFPKQNEQASSIPYRFSITYENCFLTKYPIKLFDQVREISEKLKVEEVQLKGEAPAGHISALISLIFLDKITLHTEVPEQIIVFNVSLTETQRSTIAEEMKPCLSNEGSAQITDDNATTENSPEAKRLKLDSEFAETDHAKTVSSTSTISMNLKESAETTVDLQNISFSSRLAFYMLHQQLEQKVELQDDISINPCKLTCKLTSNVQAIAPPITSIIPTNVNSQLLPTHALDNSVDENLLKSIALNYSSYIPRELLSSKNYLELLEVAYKKYVSNENVIQVGKEIFQEVCSFENLGISHVDLWKKFADLTGMTVFEHLSILMESKLVLRVGTAGFRYVGIGHGRMWLQSTFTSPPTERQKTQFEAMDVVELNGDINGEASIDSVTQRRGEALKEIKELEDSHKPDKSSEASQENSANLENQQRKSVIISSNKNLQKTISKMTCDAGPGLFLSMIWRKPNGSLNGPILVKFLRNILSHVMSSPGVTEEKICERFSLPLQPACTMEIIDTLERSHCVYRFYMKSAKAASLFSKCTQRKVALTGQPGDTIHYEAHADAMMKLNQLCDYILSYDNDS